MSKDAKDSKHKPDGPRQPQRKDSFSSVFSWAGLQGRNTAPKAPTTSSSTPQPLQTTPGNGDASRPRRHSHSAVTDIKKKARRGSTTFRTFSFSISAGTQEGASTKTRHQKTSSVNQDPKASAGTSKIGKSGSLEKVNKAASDTPNVGKNMAQNQPLRGTPYHPRSPSSPVPMPKSILRVASPDGHRRPGNFVNPDTKEPSTSPGLPPPSPMFVSMTPNSPPGSPPGSPPMSPIERPLSPGVRFAKATIHRVEVGPGRRFMPVKRKSKSTLTYISPLDPGTQKAAPKTMLQSPTKMRRHQENQAAMGRYWMRTEEEEAQWRAEAGKRAEEEAERYRNEPVGPPPTSPAKSPVEAVGGQSTLAEMITEIDKLPSLDSKPALDRVEEVVEDSSDSDSDEDAGVRCDLEPGDVVMLEKTAEGEGEAQEATEKKPEPNSGVGAQISESGSEEAKAITSTANQAKGDVPNPDPATPVTQTPIANDAKLAESRSFSERIAEKQAIDERAKRCASPTSPQTETPETCTTKPSTDKSARSSSGSLSGRSTGSNSSSGSSSSRGSVERLPKSTSTSTSQFREKEKGKEKPRAVSTVKSGGSRTEKTLPARASNQNHNHLHLRRGRRYFDHKQEITA